MSTVNLNSLPRQDGCDLDNYPRKKGHLWSWRSLKGSADGTQPGGRPLPREWKQKKQNSLVDYCDPLRTTFILEKQDNESFGFEIQTYGLQLRHHFVCMVHQGSTADCAGLTTGDVILTVNGQSIEGSPHHHVIDAVRQSGNTLKIETVYGTIMKRIELEKKISLLKQTLREKREELQNLVFQEEQLTGGGSTDSTLARSSIDSLLSPDVFASCRGCHSDSGYWSAAAAAAADGDQSSVFGDAASPSPCSAPAAGDDGHFFSQGFPDRPGSRRKIKSSGSFSVSSSSSCSGSSVSSPPYWDEGRASNVFGTLPRKGRKGSVRRHLFKLIPGLQRSVEQDVEEELDPGRPCSLHCV